MDKVASLRAFVKVVETRQLRRKPAVSFRLSRSAISKYVAELERTSACSFSTGQPVTPVPNENGQIYFERALAMLSELDAADQAVAQAQATPSGLLRINAPMSFGTLRLGPVVGEFMESIPGCQTAPCSQRRPDSTRSGRLRRHAPDRRAGILEPDRPQDRADRSRGLRFARLPCSPWHARPSSGLAQTTLLLTYGFLLTGNQWKLTGADGDHWIQPSMDAVRQQCRSAARRRNPWARRGADSDLYRRRSPR